MDVKRAEEMTDKFLSERKEKLGSPLPATLVNRVNEEKDSHIKGLREKERATTSISRGNFLKEMEDEAESLLQSGNECAGDDPDTSFQNASGPLLRICMNPFCDEVESSPNTFRACGRCVQRDMTEPKYYCGRECQGEFSQDWTGFTSAKCVIIIH